MKLFLITILLAAFVFPVALIGQEQIEITVPAGFSLISSNIHLPLEFFARNEGPDVRRMFAQFGPENNMNPMILLSNESGNFYTPRQRFCNILFWNETEGYAIEMTQERVIQWEGDRLGADLEFTISPRWNIIAYMPTYELEASAPDFRVLSPVIDGILCAIDGDGGFMIPGFEFSNMAPWRPGRGYYVNANQEVDMQYPEPANNDDPLWRPLVGDHWQLAPVSKYIQPLLINEITDGEPLDGDMMAAFSANGLMVGCGTVQDGKCGIALWGDNPNTQQVDGLRANEDYTLQYWIPEQDREIDVEIIEILQGDDAFISFNASVVRVSADLGERIQRRGVQLEAGWNLISINFTPDQEFFREENPGPDVPLMFEQLRREGGAHHIIRIVDGGGHFYSPANNFCNIPYWPLQEGLWVFIDEAGNPEWASQPRDPHEEITLDAGWNTVAFLPEEPLDASAPDFYVIAPILDAVVVAKNDEGQFMFPARRFSNMAPWEPGEGYQVRTNREIAFVYPDPQNRGAATTPILAGTHWAFEPVGQKNMSLLITDVTGVTIEPGDQIASFDMKGLLVGVGGVSDGMVGLAVWGNDEATSKNGLSAGESFDLRLWQESLGAETPLKLSISPVYKSDDVLVASARTVEAPVSPVYLSVSPNPFNAAAEVKFVMPHAGKATLGVYDLQGSLVANLKNEFLKAGNYTAVWNASASPSGIYLIKLETPAGSNATRCVLIK